MKKFAKQIVVTVLGWQVRRLQKKHNFITIGVAGSIGKTSTEFAIANVLKHSKVVRYQTGNYNDIVSVPLIFFNQSMPSLFNPIGWLFVFLRNEKKLRRMYHYDVVVVELGTDGPGQLAKFGNYLHCDITVVTAIAPEHMEFFKNLDAVAKEEFSVADYSDKIFVNGDLCEAKYYKSHAQKVTTYGQQSSNDARIEKLKMTNGGTNFAVEHGDQTHTLSMDAFGIGEIYSATAAVVLGQELGMNQAQIKTAVRSLEPVSGRMRRLDGIKDSLILDDTYNASPVAAMASLDALYSMKAPQKIALLGNMNELGEHSRAAHEEVGNYCNPAQLDHVITIGPDANKYLAAAAKAQGCEVSSFDTPYDAADFIKKHLKRKAIILAKGSQNRVFAEEAVKQLLANPKDADKLVRQSKYWLKVKKKGFKHV